MDNLGRLRLQDLQLRGHAMFSSAGLPMGSISIEYAWLVEILIGDIQGLLSFIHVCFVVLIDCQKLYDLNQDNASEFDRKTFIVL